MKTFAFSLARMRNYKQQLLDKEKHTLSALRKKRQEIEQQMIELEKHRIEKHLELQTKQQQGMNATELCSYKFWIENSKHQLKDLELALIKADKEVEHQLQIVVIASQDVSALDKLEEKQKDEFQLLENKEKELEILEYVTIDLVRNQQTT
ncbi:flagellar export protein FliJ [Scatolibacter rhodanostii]|uniref:flagellar export protein FliJ n=1 Tax=Scatolibacter rhodanostii TaxID=2014781 RepID=UPI000C0799F8|nr:flagellar FliJ family protein [Scatolibacter rhodanostii]